MPSWHLLMNRQEPLTPEQSDFMDTLDSFADGFVGLETGPNYSQFVCYFEADSLMDAITQALARFEDVPGVAIRTVELNPCSFDHNGMATASVVPWPD
ncbi:hypothetical protein [Streptomyces sp. NPDC020965]|uniref:hypothetical protein n=1 Tax=Streptomyces sp. NPDC020965 TaxID=3365105 RepID=UPI0037B6E08C